MHRQRKVLFIWTLAAVGLGWVMFWPVLWLELELTDSDAQRYVTRLPAGAGETFAVRFIHSVEQSPVTEYFVLNEDGAVVLTGTRYYGFGAGLPTDGAEGTFARDGDAFVIAGLYRKINTLRVRLSPSNEYTLIHRHQEYSWPSAASGARLTVRGVRAGRLTSALTKLVERSK